MANPTGQNFPYNNLDGSYPPTTVISTNPNAVVADSGQGVPTFIPAADAATALEYLDTETGEQPDTDPGDDEGGNQTYSQKIDPTTGTNASVPASDAGPSFFSQMVTAFDAMISVPIAVAEDTAVAIAPTIAASIPSTQSVSDAWDNVKSAVSTTAGIVTLGLVVGGLFFLWRIEKDA